MSYFNGRVQVVLFMCLLSVSWLSACDDATSSSPIQLQGTGSGAADGTSQAVPIANVGDTEQSGVSAESSGASTGCAELLVCAGRCGDNEPCVDGCVQQAGETALSQLRALALCIGECEQMEDADACGERNCVEPLITCLGGRQMGGETVESLRMALAGRLLSRTDTWSDTSSGAVGFATETETKITLCASGQFAYEEETQNFASGNVGGDDLSASSGDRSDAQGQWQVYSLGGTYILELARTDGRTQVLSIAVQAGALYLDGQTYDVGDADSCP